MRKIPVISLMVFLAISLFILTDSMTQTARAWHIANITCRIIPVKDEGTDKTSHWIYNYTVINGLGQHSIVRVTINRTNGAPIAELPPFPSGWSLELEDPVSFSFQCVALQLGGDPDIDVGERATFAIVSPCEPIEFDWETLDDDDYIDTGRVAAPDHDLPSQNGNYNCTYDPCSTYVYTVSHVKGEIYSVFLYLEPEVCIQNVNLPNPAWQWYVNNTYLDFKALVVYTDTTPVNETNPEISFSLSSPNSVPGNVTIASCGGVERLIGPVPRWGVQHAAHELFGPRLDRLLIKMYTTMDAEFTALELGQIDVIDSCLTKDWITKWSFPPYNESITLSYDGNGWKAYNKRYVGTPGIPDAEDVYEGHNWVGFVNQTSFGVNSWGTFLSAHPQGYERGDGSHMTIRYGFSNPTLEMLNPIYSTSYWDWQVLDKIYDTMIISNASNLSESMPWLTEYCEVGTYINPIYGNCTKVRFTLRPDLSWADGTPLTTADICFTLKELKDVLTARGYPPPTWIENVQNIIDFKILDPYNFEVLFTLTNTSALNWAGHAPILPKHIWKPIVETGDPTVFAPDPNLIGSGPWRFLEYVEYSHITMAANRPGSIVTTNLPGSIPITSPNGYFRYGPLGINIELADENENKQVSFCVGNITAVDLAHPNCSNWAREYFGLLFTYHIKNWTDNHKDGLLGKCDKVEMDLPSGGTAWYHVKEFEVIGLLGITMYGMELELDPETLHVISSITIKNEWLGGSIYVDKYVYLDGSLLPGYPIILAISPGASDLELLIMNLAGGKHTLKVATHISSAPWTSTWHNATEVIWVTITEDIIGSTFYDDIGLPTYRFKTQLPAPDFSVDGKDISKAASSFGAIPGHARWGGGLADVTGDFSVDGKDISRMAKLFGWP